MEGQKNLMPLYKIWGCFLLGHLDRGMQYLGGSKLLSVSAPGVAHVRINADHQT